MDEPPAEHEFCSLVRYADHKRAGRLDGATIGLKFDGGESDKAGPGEGIDPALRDRTKRLVGPRFVRRFYRPATQFGQLAALP
jgi:hypothetical protein